MLTTNPTKVDTAWALLSMLGGLPPPLEGEGLMTTEAPPVGTPIPVAGPNVATGPEVAAPAPVAAGGEATPEVGATGASLGVG